MKDGSTQTSYALRIDGDDASEHALFFDETPDLPSGAEIKVWGEMRGDGIHVSSYEVVPGDSSSGLGKSREAIIDGTPYPSRTFGYILVNIGGGNGTYTAAQARIDLLGTGASDGSTKQWFLEASYGRQDISGNVAAGFSYTMNGCNYSALANGLRSQANSALGLTPDHYLWFFLTENDSCGWAGLAAVGSATNPADDTWYNASSGCTVLVQEPAHNFGMQHSSSLRCGSAVFANNPSSCTHDEYGDRHDPMGGGCRHTNAWQKAYQGWFGGCNSVRVNQSGTFTVHPLEVECNGIQVLQVPMPVTTRTIPRSGGGGNASNDPVQFYYLELRTRTGFDQSQTTYPTVLVRVGPDYRSRTQTGLHTWILDMNPATTGQNSFDGLGAGQSFTDPAGGVSFSVQSISATSASIQVTVPTNTANTCAGGGNITAPGPTTCGATGRWHGRHGRYGRHGRTRWSRSRWHRGSRRRGCAARRAAQVAAARVPVARALAAQAPVAAAALERDARWHAGGRAERGLGGIGGFAGDGGMSGGGFGGAAGLAGGGAAGLGGAAGGVIGGAGAGGSAARSRRWRRRGGSRSRPDRGNRSRPTGRRRRRRHG